ncbi:sigma-54 dependent transcriptional regulator [Desulfuromonas sp. KJ2020]|uniref:sigma-54-dependent transcriptional regulator n=1 Tax=Desulfuromonas sp. KJ2020 TaxID=2919173 RepID=UPI0020A73487|nr:sigma-54 dependent transcriptional regulator [Desulfuromonas sp. KJ2020]MCP3177097.1 sigma-54 dependent transcriptional regulator [Desulfuromonas sp. KJ2020]
MSDKIRILVVDDDPLTCRILERMLNENYRVSTYTNSEDGLRHLRSQGTDLLLTDLKMPGLNGFELMAKAHEINPAIIVFIITGFSSLDNAVAAVKKGAYDYIAKPFEPDDVQMRIARALKERALENQVDRLRQERQRGQEQGTPLTRNARMEELLELARRVAMTDSNVLIQGETGVGKEVLARFIHRHSPRVEEAFVPVNCGALAEGVLESELFGHEKGAFTGATARRSGYFELADKGTLLLDEIGTTNANFQVKLLRVLQERLVHPVGSSRPVPVDVRLIAATNIDLAEAARSDLFRSDLYYRLSVVTLHIPPLRERGEDIPLLAGHFLEKYRHINPRVRDISPEGLARLQGYVFPGNVRELENIIERALILTRDDTLGPDTLLLGGMAPVPSQTGEGKPLAMEEAERNHILQVLAQCGGRKGEAAEALGINKSTLWRKMKRFGLD